MPNQERNGRNVAVPDENRPSWRPQDEQQRNRRNLTDDDDSYRDDGYIQNQIRVTRDNRETAGTEPEPSTSANDKRHRA